jgi:SAM-dependent methyltransferase
MREETYGEDIGQTSWLAADELRRFLGWLGLTSAAYVLEVASGSGGPALFLARTTGAQVMGVDIHEQGVANAKSLAHEYGLNARVQFQQADASQPLPFDDQSFDALICIDSINHLPGRRQVFQEWHRVVKPGGSILFTDPIVVTGMLSNEEIAIRSSLGYFLFTPVGENERFLEEARFDVVRTEDVTANAVDIAARWHNARARRQAELVEIEGQTTFDGMQRFLAVVHTLANERRLSRFVWLARKRSGAS